MRTLAIAVDFDGTIVQQAWPGIGAPIPGALPALRDWAERGHRIIVWTCRAGQQLHECHEWLEHHGVPYAAVNCNLDERIKLYGGDTRKVNADLYVDDKGVGAPSGHRLWTLARREVTRLEKETIT